MSSAGIYFTPLAMGQNGMVAGQQGARSYAWNVSDGLMQIPGFFDDHANAWGANAAGQVVGGSYLNAQGYYEAFVWDKVSGTRPVANFGCQSEAGGINDLGHIVGHLFFPPAGPPQVPFLWKPAQGYITLQLLATGKSAVAELINNHDVVAGSALDANGNDHAVIWNPDGTLVDMGQLFSQYQNQPTGINDLGYICGSTFGPLGSVSYLRNLDGTYLPLYNPFNSAHYIYAQAINNHNTIVGDLYGPQNTDEAFVWNQQGGYQMVNDNLDPGSAGWNITELNGINDAGQMAGVGYLDAQPFPYAVLVTPVGPAKPVSGTVSLGNYIPGPNGVSVTVQLYSAGTTTLVDTEQATLGSDGNFTINTQAPIGNYDVDVKASHWLRRKSANKALTASGLSGLTFSLINGDINGDNVISLADFGALRAAFGNNSNPNADLNGDGVVSLADFAILRQNFGQQGD